MIVEKFLPDKAPYKSYIFYSFTILHSYSEERLRRPNTAGVPQKE